MAIGRRGFDIQQFSE